jgi:hypothetical protein
MTPTERADLISAKVTEFAPDIATKAPVPNTHADDAERLLGEVRGLLGDSVVEALGVRPGHSEKGCVNTHTGTAFWLDLTYLEKPAFITHDPNRVVKDYRAILPTWMDGGESHFTKHSAFSTEAGLWQALVYLLGRP